MVDESPVNVASGPGLLLGSQGAWLPAVLQCHFSPAWPGLHHDFKDTLEICREKTNQKCVVMGLGLLHLDEKPSVSSVPSPGLLPQLRHCLPALSHALALIPSRGFP